MPFEKMKVYRISVILEGASDAVGDGSGSELNRWLALRDNREDRLLRVR